jgi:hypothetical protein
MNENGNTSPPSFYGRPVSHNPSGQSETNRPGTFSVHQTFNPSTSPSSLKTLQNGQSYSYSQVGNNNGQLPDSQIPGWDFRDPFYEVADTLCQFLIKPARYGASTIEGNQTLSLSYNDYSNIKQKGLVLQIQCAITKSTDAVSATKTHRWPVGCILRVNNSLVDLIPKDEKKRTIALPAIITPFINVGANQIRLTASSMIPHHAHIVRAKKVTTEQLVQQMKIKAFMSTETAKQKNYQFL